jgi:molybdenum cofactor cytidylyltransferase
MIPGIVLAAGQSSRMGTAKALLRCPPDQQTFVARIVTVLRAGGVADALVVGRPDDEALAAEIDAIVPPPRLVVNPDPNRGQLSSLIAGLNAADRPGVRAVLVMPVDIPLVRASTVTAVLRAFEAAAAPVARAAFGGRHGHPVIFARAVFEEIRRADPIVGAKAVLRAHDRDILNVEVPDAHVLSDVDAPADYERLFGKRL